MDWPWEYSFPPFFTLQPHHPSRQKQIQSWKHLVIAYCQVEIFFKCCYLTLLFTFVILKDTLKRFNRFIKNVIHLHISVLPKIILCPFYQPFVGTETLKGLYFFLQNSVGVTFQFSDIKQFKNISIMSNFAK